MFPSWRTKIRDARRAFRAGRWDEAGALLQRESVREFLPAKQLSAEVASHLLQRAGQRMESGDSSAGWKDVHLAARLGGREDQLRQLRDCYTQRSLEQIRHYLVCGETVMAREEIRKLEQRRLGGQQRRVWKLIVGLISQAKALSRTGNALEAAEILQRAKQLLPDQQDTLAGQITERQDQLRSDAKQISRATQQLHEAVRQEDWTTVLSVAEALLELAPEDKSARQARRLAWKAVGMDATRIAGQPAMPGRLVGNRRTAKTTHNGASSAQIDTMTTDRELERRLVAWIDGVGGYLICLGDEVILGQPAAPPHVDIPILADLSRRHASLRREGESYVLTPIHTVSVNGQKLSGPVVLTGDAVIELGDTVRLQFRKPHALSATAVLTLLSHHKTEPAVDGIVLMSDSCILGPQRHSHICCQEWPEELVLFRRGEDLHFRSASGVELDGQLVDQTAPLPGNCRLEAENFVVSFEDL